MRERELEVHAAAEAAASRSAAAAAAERDAEAKAGAMLADAEARVARVLTEEERLATDKVRSHVMICSRLCAQFKTCTLLSTLLYTHMSNPL